MLAGAVVGVKLNCGASSLSSSRSTIAGVVVGAAVAAGVAESASESGGIIPWCEASIDDNFV